MTPAAPFGLRTENLCFGYKPGSWVLKDVSLSLPEGSFNMMVGTSGSGKTTLLKVLAGFLPAGRGKIFLFGEEARAPLPAPVRVRIGYIPQQLGLVRNLSVLDNVLTGCLGRRKGLGPLLGFFPRQEIERARGLLARLGIAAKEDEKVIRLSGGERQRVAIARTLMQDPSLILADEFVSDLDAKTAAEILGLMREIGRRDRVTFLMSMHELGLVKEFSGSVIVMKGGAVTGMRPSEEFDASVLEGMTR